MLKSNAEVETKQGGLHYLLVNSKSDADCHSRESAREDSSMGYT